MATCNPCGTILEIFWNHVDRSDPKPKVKRGFLLRYFWDPDPSVILFKPWTPWGFLGSHNHQLVTCNPQGMLLEMLWKYVDVLECPGVVFVCWKYCLLGGHQKLSRKITMFPSTGLKFILTMGCVTRPSKVFLSLLHKEPSGRFAGHRLSTCLLCLKSQNGSFGKTDQRLAAKSAPSSWIESRPREARPEDSSIYIYI